MDQRENIWAQNGIVTYTGYKNCTIEHDGYQSNGEFGSFTGRHYGLVKYLCDNTTGYLMSKVSCIPCGIYCPINDNIDGCQHVIFPYIIGIIMGIVMFLITKLIMAKIIWPTVINIQIKIKERAMKRKDKKNDKKAERVANRILLRGLTDANPITIMIIVGLLIAIVDACDNTLYISSSGSVCDGYGCQSTSTYDMTLESGSTLCFRDNVGDLMTIRLKSSKMVIRSSLMYYATDYVTSVNQIWECKGAGRCWNGACDRTSEHPALSRNISGLEIQGYGCGTNTLGCDVWCWHQTSCTFYRWSMTQTGNLFPVYRTISRMWSVDIELTYKNKTNNYSLNVNNPRFDLSAIDTNRVSILVNGFSAQEDILDNYYLFADGSFYNTDASMINMPETDKIGDAQVDLHKTKMIYNENAITCTTHSCKTLCTTGEPRIRRMLRRLGNYNKHEGVFIGDKHTALTSYKINGLVRVMIGNVKLNSLRVMRPRCKLTMIGSYSCVGCMIKPYAVIQASEISEPGILEFNSNCTFDTEYISCSQEPVRISPLDGNKHCNIYVGVLNVSLTIDFEYGFVGSLDPSIPIVAYGTSIEDYSSLLMNKNLWDSISYSWLSLSVFSLLMSLIIKNFRGIVGFLTAAIVIKKVEKEAETGV
nr:MAG: glycoprotein [Aedes japonicus bunyavirus 2]